MGETIAHFLRSTTGPRLSSRQRAMVERNVAAVAAHGAYAGLALWALASLSKQSHRTKNTAVALAGLSMGLLKRGPCVASRN